MWAMKHKISCLGLLNYDIIKNISIHVSDYA